MQAPTPAKIKSFLGTIKLQYLDNEEVVKNAETTYLALLKMELVLRGVIVEDDKKLWQEVLSNIGKALLTETSVPVPLLAGTNVMAGRVAEACYQNRESFQSNKSAASSALKRAKEIKDKRFIILLEQEFDPLQIAKGYFARAAKLQPDTPPMWKKLWDTIIEQQPKDKQQEVPFEAQTAIDNLIRIADSKGNVKRSNELRLKLIQSYLNESGRETGKNQIANLFANREDAVTLSTDAKVLADLAREALESCLESKLVDNSDRMLYQTLQLRVKIALEEATIDQIAQERYKNNKNRSVSTSLERLRLECRTELFLQSDDDVLKVSIALRDSLLNIWTNNGNSSLPLCLKWTQKALARLHNRAQVVSIANDYKAWKTVLQYTLPILNTVKNNCSWDMKSSSKKDRMENINNWLQQESFTSHQKELVSFASTIFPNVYWMVLGSHSVLEAVDDEVFYFLLDILTVLQKVGVEKQAKAEVAVGSKKQASTEGQKLQYSKSLVLCFLCQDNPDIMYQITREALSSKTDKGPLGFMRCLVSWSGWFQRSWPYCSNLSDARRMLNGAQIDIGRPLTVVEQSFLDLSCADAELMDGGFLKDAGQLYMKVQDRIQEVHSLDEGAKVIFLAHCTNGLARVVQRGVEIQGGLSTEEYGKQTLRTLDQSPPLSRLLIWHESTVLSASIPHQQSLARQLIAESFIIQNRCDEARVFLEAAVNDSPFDSDAAFALGAFLLRMAFFVNQERSEETDKIAQIQLLKAAKLNPSKANPFALLGFWFEEKGDIGRARGCYSKSLGLDPCHPVAGRGLLRLEEFERAKGFLEKATDQNSPWNGWAWHAMGLNKVSLEGEDDFAVVALLKALRCRDITQRDSEALGIFYHKLNSMRTNEKAIVLGEIGQCYRRLGRFTASIRSFHGAIETFEDAIPSSLLCSCAQVELELALFDDAAEKFRKVLDEEDEMSVQHVAAYGHGIALLSIAQRHYQDGKAGAALESIKLAASSCMRSGNFACTQKLLGDLYSFASVLPPAIFRNASLDDQGNLAGCIEEKLNFVSRGEEAYRSALKSHEPDEQMAMKGSFLCDIASNILLQAQIMSTLSEGDSEDTDINNRYDKAAMEFHNAIVSNPLYAPSWCGLGCAVVRKDPLLAQHAFCRCLQIERMLPEGYSNAGFLYTSLSAFDSSEEMMNALTQVADTPMMWINRAFMLEHQAMAVIEDTTKATHQIFQAADAYRAALQVMKQPDAMIGLAVTNRVTMGRGEMKASMSHDTLFGASRRESLALTSEFIEASSRFRKTASTVRGVMSLEQAMVLQKFEWSDEIFELGKQMLAKGIGDESNKLSLDIGSIQNCLDSISGKATKNQIDSSIFSNVETQKQILINPNRPELWLDLTKELVSCLDDSSSEYKIDSALQAAKRALNMMSQTLYFPHRSDGHNKSIIRAEMISDSLSLVKCLQELGKEEETTQDHSYDLQRSMMMCPNNALAREAFGLV